MSSPRKSVHDHVPAPLRQSTIRGLLARRGRITIAELADYLHVSQMTVRRDLDELVRGGELRRTHGGAIPAERMTFSFGLEGRRASHRAAKQAIAARAAQMVVPGQRLILDAGTTVLELAHLLRDRRDLTVITPSLAVAAELQFSEGIEVILVGGVVRSGTAALAGVVTETVLDMLWADLAFQGTDGIDLDGGLYTADLRVARVDQLVRSRAAKTYVLADASKIGHGTLVRHGRLGEIEAMITDDGVGPRDLARLRRAGKVIVVKTAPARRSRPLKAKERS